MDNWIEEARKQREKELFPNECQRRELCELLHHVLVDIREYGYEGKYLEVAELAEIFHNIPNEMFGDGLWDLTALIQRLKDYRNKYGGRNYVSYLNGIFKINRVRNTKDHPQSLQEFL